MSELVEVRNLTKVYEKKNMALDHMNLVIPRGRIIGLLGPNGSGKTTLIKIINGLLVPTEGEIYVNGIAPGAETKSVVSYLPERTYFQSSMKVKELINFFTDFYQDFRPERAKEMLKNLGISEDARLKTLSKGTKEKVQLIMVMSRRARLYLLDEPIGGVDPATRDYILRTIIQNYSPDSTILISTHLIADVEPILDDFLFLKNGRVVLSGNVKEFCAQKGYTLDEAFRREFRC